MHPQSDMACCPPNPLSHPAKWPSRLPSSPSQGILVLGLLVTVAYRHLGLVPQVSTGLRSWALDWPEGTTTRLAAVALQEVWELALSFWNTSSPRGKT